MSITDCDGSSTCAALDHVEGCYAVALQARWCDEHGQPWLTCTACPPTGAACLLTEADDLEAFASLPDCLECGGTGKAVPPGFRGGGGG